MGSEVHSLWDLNLLLLTTSAPHKNMSRSFEGLIAWQKAMDLAEIVYTTTNRFPRQELFGLTAQLRRAVVSIPSNLAEGCGRITRGEWRQFTAHARGSALEVHTQLLIAQRLRFGDSDRVAFAIERTKEVSRLINGLMNWIKAAG